MHCTVIITNDQGYVSLVLITSRSFSHAWLITGFVSRLTRRVPLVEQEPSLFRSTPVFSVVRVTPSLVLCVMFIERCLSVCSFPFGHCVVCPSSICGFWLPLWYLQTLLVFYAQVAWHLSCMLHSFTSDTN